MNTTKLVAYWQTYYRFEIHFSFIFIIFCGIIFIFISFSFFEN